MSGFTVHFLTFWQDTNALPAVSNGFKLDVAVSLGKNCVIPAQANIEAGLDAGTALANDNVARPHLLTAELFDTQSLRITVTTIATGTSTRFMSHLSDLLWTGVVRRRSFQYAAG
jgi:hypothetical protein